MRFDENADLDTSRIDDLRGSGGGGGGGLGGRVAVGGGGLGIVGLILFFVVSALGGGGGTGTGGGFALPGGLSGLQQGQTADNTAIAETCRTGADANTSLECEVTAVVNSLDGYWSDTFARSGQTYTPPRTNFFEGSVSTGGCGSATSDVGPFYCPGDSEIYIDLSFFKELETRFGARGGPFARAYVLAHEYGHHIQNLLGTNSRVRAGDSGPTSGSVRLELQADCYAGVWGNHATTTPTASGRPLITDVTQDDVNAALDTAERIGDDYIQSNLGGGRVDKSQFTHGTSAQREKWFTTGFRTGDPARCDTFGTNNLG
ncbi:KPN_02809 family neutral zinc metallopeptidase [Pseudonocardia sp. T1-2H]|uniref:KPN_02809 family neutral zinc metallopeptidase n=1 Tax=Pseudonocardia sp. T1-2H TaxID=3128899 RepID=UPI0031014781